MKLYSTPLSDLMVIEPLLHSDSRGYFCETYQSKQFLLNYLDYFFVQDNEAFSQRGVVRGLHFQKGKMAQAKLVRVAIGEVLDVVVDLRKDSPTFGEHFSILLSAANKKQLLIPRGFAHGYSVLSQEALFLYKCDNYYSKADECGIHPMDKSLSIDWKLDLDEIKISDKDLLWPSFNPNQTWQ